VGIRPPKFGLVICKPFGFEALCGQRSVRTFAEAATDQGVPALRFDYHGTGDSANIDAGADQIETWVQDILAAVEELRRRTGVERVGLVGLRLGALLATLAAARSTAISALFLISPVVSGKRYLRDLRTARLASLLGIEAEEGSSPPGNSEASAGSMEFSGHSMSVATMDTLSRIDLAKLPSPPVTELAIIDRIDLPVARPWSEALASSGRQVEYLALPGFVEMMQIAPQYAVVPKPMVAAMGAWLQRLGCNSPGSGADLGGPPAASVLTVSTTTAMRVSIDDSDADAGITERPVCFGSEVALFGIVTEPRRGELRQRAVILLNAGADYHIGVSRMYVSLARSWARHGYVVLRMDLAGIGDSSTRSGRPDDEVFPPEALQDVRAALDFVRERYRARDMTLTGLCSGAYHALRAAAVGLGMDRILMVNPQNYFWKEGMSLEALQIAEVVRNPTVYRERVLSTKAWRRLLAGQVNIWRIIRIYVQRSLLGLESTLRDMARSCRIRLPQDLGWELEQIDRRGKRVVFVFARGEPGIELLKIQGGSSIRKLGDRCRIHIIDSADHTFSRSNPRAAMEKVLSDELFADHTVKQSV
jgi:alpha-beta hydrolase superfamily lysophospholipase